MEVKQYTNVLVCDRNKCPEYRGFQRSFIRRFPEVLYMEVSFIWRFP